MPSTTNTKRRYMVLFNEGPGYLLVDSLAEGSYSVTMLVLSLGDKKLYVRKLHDVQVFNPRLTIQCQDAENAVSHRFVPSLLSTKYYPETISVKDYDRQGHVRRTDHKFVTPATVWQFCNGGQLGNIFNEWYNNESRVRVPESFIWLVLNTMIHTLVDIHETGLAHRDIHEGNILLHQTDQPLGKVFLVDFGMSSRYPTVNDRNFRRPFTGKLDSHGNPVEGNLSQEERKSIAAWYGYLRDDINSTVELLVTLLCRGNVANFRGKFLGPGHSQTSDRTSKDFLQAVLRNKKGLNKYSDGLVAAIFTWETLYDRYRERPAKLLVKLKEVASEIQADTARSIAAFNADPVKVANEVELLRLEDQRQAFPATWKDPKQLLESEDPKCDWAIRVNKIDEQRGQARNDDVFFHYREGNGPNAWPRGRPHIGAETNGMTQHVDLRIGEFQVVEALVDEHKGTFRIVRRL